MITFVNILILLSTAIAALVILRKLGKEDRGLALAIGYACLVIYMIVYNSVVGGFKGIAVMENVYLFGCPTLWLINLIAGMFAENPSPPVWLAYIMYFLGVFQYYLYGWVVQKIYVKMKRT